MLNRLAVLWVRALTWVAGFVLVTTLLVVIGRSVITWSKLCPDYMCFWATGKILASGHSPYDFDLQAQVQQEYGWDKATEGLGFYDFLPYYYPPSVLGVVCVLLVPLGYPTARMAWFVTNIELLLITGYMLRHAVVGVPRVIPLIAVPAFGLSILSVLVGQLTPLIFFLIVATWRLLAHRWDRSAGWVLAWMTIKPQLTLLLLAAILIWSFRQQRWQVLKGFATGLVLLLAVSTCIVPSWPVQLVRAIGQTPPVTAKFPWVGTTWLLVLRSLGLEGWVLWALYGAAALPWALLVLRVGLRRESPLDDVFALSLLAAFFIAPYARIYDLPVLIVPLVVLIGGRLQQIWAGVLLFIFVVVPYVHFVYWGGPDPRFAQHVWFFWIPLLLAIVWFTSRFKLQASQASGFSGDM